MTATLDIFESLGSEPRLAIVKVLMAAGRPLAVKDVVDLTQSAQSNVSRHLTHMRKSGVVLSEAAGQMRMYTVKKEVRDLVHAADQIR